MALHIPGKASRCDHSPLPPSSTTAAGCFSSHPPPPPVRTGCRGGGWNVWDEQTFTGLVHEARVCSVYFFFTSRAPRQSLARAPEAMTISPSPAPGTQLVCTNKTFTFPPGTVLLLLLVLAAVVKGRDLPPPFFPPTRASTLPSTTSQRT